MGICWISLCVDHARESVVPILAIVRCVLNIAHLVRHGAIVAAICIIALEVVTLSEGL